MILRFLLLAFAVLLAADAFMPGATEPLRVDRHVLTQQRQGSSRFWQTGYELRFVGGRTDSCDVGYEAYAALNDGDDVTVSSSHIFKTCTAISRGDEEIMSTPHARRWTVLFAIAIVVFVALPRSVLSRWSDDEDDRPGRRWFGL